MSAFSVFSEAFTLTSGWIVFATGLTAATALGLTSAVFDSGVVSTVFSEAKLVPSAATITFVLSLVIEELESANTSELFDELLHAIKRAHIPRTKKFFIFLLILCEWLY